MTVMWDEQIAPMYGRMFEPAAMKVPSTMTWMSRVLMGSCSASAPSPGDMAGQQRRAELRGSIASETGGDRSEGGVIFPSSYSSLTSPPGHI